VASRSRLARPAKEVTEMATKKKATKKKAAKKKKVAKKK
jgi:hypothetical protein